MELEKIVTLLGERVISLEADRLKTAAEILALKEVLLTVGQNQTKTARVELSQQLEARVAYWHEWLLEGLEERFTTRRRHAGSTPQSEL